MFSGVHIFRKLDLRIVVELFVVDLFVGVLCVGVRTFDLAFRHDPHEECGFGAIRQQVDR